MEIKNTIKQIACLLWERNITDRILTILSIVLVYVSSIGTVLVPLLFKQAVDLSQQPVVGALSVLPWLLISYGLAWSLNQGVDALRTFLAFNRISKILTIIFSNTLDKLAHMPFSFHLNKKTGEIINIFNRMEVGLPNLIYSTLIQVIPLLIEIVLAIGIVIKIFGLIYGALLLVTVGTHLIFTVSTTKKNIEYQLSCNGKVNAFSNYMLDVLQHYDTVKYFNNEEYEKQQIYDLLKEKETSSISMYRRMGTVNIIQALIVGLGLTLITLLSGYDTVNHKITLGSFILLNTYTLQFARPMSNFGYILLNIKRSFVDTQAFLGLTTSMVPFPDKTSKITIKRPDIEFKEVSYYIDQQKILDNVSFKVPYGQTVGVVGKTGSGKSTLIKLLLGIIEPASGTIFIGGIDIKEIPQNKLVNLFGIVPQDSALFNRSIVDNIRYGNLTASESEIDEIMNKLELGHLDKERLTGERGLKLSGGEKQRVAIARIFLRKPQICIFDEFTASLDGATEKAVLGHITELFNKQTKIIISHKNTTLINADLIIAIKEGKIICDQFSTN